MSAGAEWTPECEEYEDALSGARVRRLTDHKGHSHHLYFTNPGWWDGARRLLFGSDRHNCANIFSVELESGRITQLTDFEGDANFQRACVNPRRPEAYFWRRGVLTALHLETLETRPLLELPEGFRPSIINCTADGSAVCGALVQDLSDTVEAPLHYAYATFEQTWRARPLCRIARVSTDGSGAETAWEEQTWIGHVNTSPTRANLLTFCHEGPWDKVDNRIWGLDLETGEAWRIRPRQGSEAVGHEYWHADGEHLGYHGRRPDGRKFFGRVRYDDTGRQEVDFPFETGHIHSNDFSLIVGDASPVVRLWRWNGEGFDGPRVLCEHRCSFNVQKVHVHPRFSPSGDYVVFTSDATGYGNVYQAWVPEWDSLPQWEG